MLRQANAFWSSEQGAVTVDWVVLTAAVSGLGIAALATVSSGVKNTSTQVDTMLRSTQIMTWFDRNYAGIDFNFDGGDALDFEPWEWNHPDVEFNASDALGAVTGDTALVFTTASDYHNGYGGFSIRGLDPSDAEPSVYEFSYWARVADSEASVTTINWDHASGEGFPPMAQEITSDWQQYTQVVNVTEENPMVTRLFLQGNDPDTTYAVDDIEFRRVE